MEEPAPEDVCMESIEFSDNSDSPPDQTAPDTAECSVIDEALQYAYQHNLISDHLLSSFSLTSLFGKLIQTTFPPTNEDGFTDSTHLADLEVPDIILREHLSLTDSACRLISEAYHDPKDEDIEALTRRVYESVSISNQRLELPILRSDNDWDLREFKKEQLSRLYIPIKNHRLPLDTPDNEAGEGMALPASVREESDLFYEKIQGERIGVTKNALKFLADQLRADITKEDLISYLISELKYKKNPALQKITPPVSPKLGGESNYFVPQAEACLVPIPSGDSFSLSENSRSIENALLADYQDQWSEITTPVRELLEAEYPIEEGASLQQDSTRCLDDLKVEMPLMLDSAPREVKVSAEDIFKNSTFATLDLDPEFEKVVLVEIPDDGLGEDFQKAAEDAARSVEQEQLQHVDAIARIPIPMMDFSVTEPGWIQLHTNERSILKWIQAGKEDLFKPPNWPIHKGDESKLIWKPLSAKISPVLNEDSMDNEEHLVDRFTGPVHDEELLTSADFVRRASHFVVLQNEDEDEDEEIEPQLAKSKPRKDLMDIVRKRTHGGDKETAKKRPRRGNDEPPPGQHTQLSGPSLLPGHSHGTSGRLLANFLEIHAPKKTWSHSKYFVSQRSESAETAPVEKMDTSTDPSEDLSPKKFAASVIIDMSLKVAAACPEITVPSTPVMVFISIKIPRRLIRTLEGLVPNLQIFERDYNAHDTSFWRPGSVARTVVVPSMANDADITVSPSTGIIVTHMIRVRQKPISGTNKSMVQTRIAEASLRYNRLIVLIGGEGGTEDDLRLMSSSDSAALTELQGFATGLDCIVQVHYLGGGDSTLAKWVAFCICRYGTLDNDIQSNLLPVETVWELFLRRAGFNVYAAQAVVSQLKPTVPGSETVQIGQYGLAAFVTMTRAERLRKFGQLVGPKVLGRVSAAVDETWNRE